MKSGLISMYLLLKEARMYILCPSYYTYGTYNRKDAVLLQKWIYFLNRKPIRDCNENIILIGFMYSFIKIGELIWNHKWFDEKRANQIIINLYIMLDEPTVSEIRCGKQYYYLEFAVNFFWWPHRVGWFKFVPVLSNW